MARVTASPATLHVVTLTPSGASGQLFKSGPPSVDPATPAANAVEPAVGQTAPFTALFAGTTPITSPLDGAGFWEWKEEVNALLGSGPGSPPANAASPYDGFETSAEPLVDITSVSMPSSYNGENLSGLGSELNKGSLGEAQIFPGMKLVTSFGAGNTGVVQGEGTVTVKAQITGDIRELNSWVEQWQPTNSIPKFNGSDYGTVRSEGYGADNGPFVINFTLLFYLKELKSDSSRKFEKSFSIHIINNFNNDRDQYKLDYENAYKSLTKVPELSERAS
tara:strand:- start:341 stop:1174 length:834 start_codon:yes stop_codon:yes gene_type:complete